MSAIKQAIRALQRAELKAHALGREFSGPRFTDRHNDGPQLIEVAGQCAAAIDRLAEIEGALREITEPVEGMDPTDGWGHYRAVVAYAATILNREPTP